MIIIIALLTSFVVYGQDTNSLIKLSLERTPYLKAYAHGIESAISQKKQAGLLANPIVTLQSGGLKTGSDRGSVLDVTINQPFPWPGRRQARIEVQEYLRKISNLDLEEARLELAHRVFLLCAEISFLKELESHNAERRQRFALIIKYYESRPIVSPAEQVEKALLNAQIKIIEKSMLSLSTDKANLLSELELLSGVKDPKFDLSWEKLPLPPELKTDVLLKENMRARRAALTQELGGAEVEATRYEARPDILLGMNYREENMEPANHFYHAQVSLVIPIIDRGQHSIETARARLRRVEAESKVLVRETENELFKAQRNLQLAWKSLQLFPLTKKHDAEDTFEKAEKAFRKGQLNTSLFLQTDTQFHSVIDEIFTSRLDYYEQWAQLRKMMGQLPEL